MSALEGTTELPGVGKVKKGYVVAGGALVVGIVGYAWWARSRSSEEAAPDFYADTRTGSELPGDGYTNPGGIDTGGDQDDGERAPRTDEEWAARVLEKLTWYEPGYVSGIIARYLANQIVTATEANVIREAWAQVGKPPGGQQIRTSPTGPTTPVTPTPPPATTIPVLPRPPAIPPPATATVTTAPKPPAPVYIPTAKFTTRNPPWNSTLSGIAGRYKTSVSALMKLNPSIKNKDVIPYPGRIRVK